MSAAAPVPTAARARPAPLADSLVMTGRAIRVVARTPTAIVASAFMPLILMVVMTISFAKVVSPGSTYADYVNQVLPLFAAMGMMFSSITTGVTAHADLHSGMEARLHTLPMAPSAPLIGRIAGDATRNLFTLLVLGAVGAALGFRLRAGVPAALAGVGVALLFGAAFAWLAVAAAIRAGSAESMATALNGPLLVLSFLSTGFVPADDLPGWAQPLARNSPVSATVDAMRALTQGGATTGPVLRSLAWSAGITAVFATVAIRRTRHR